ncbi:kinesin-like protein KIF14 [Harmonia axyridis]|uniref:kinesin-like protein KIF14 n=1 Tax=Harmonia axyridis TaxID=115357 RepID=UPI001E275CA6|nr:kinesin-like protein KIF14 [Harmonia axyridis]
MAFLATSTPKSYLNDEISNRIVGRIGNKTARSKICYPSTLINPRTSQGGSAGGIKSTITKDNSKKNEDSIDKISVAVRIRPISGREILNDGEKNIISIRNNAIYVDVDPRKKTSSYKFNVDKIFQSYDENDSTYFSQERIYQSLGVPLLQSAFKGYNACLLAYGQTGSGKSFSMMGRSEADIDSEEYSGLIPRFCRDLISRTNNLPDNCSATLNISYCEIYNEKIYDLLLTEDITNRSTLKVRENPVTGPYVENLSYKTVKTYDELRLWLLIGNRNRAIAATNMNEQSSRSHSIFKVDLNFLSGILGDGNEENRSRRSSVSLVDLAGNERLLNEKLGNCNSESTPRSRLELHKKGENNDEKLRESCSINKSLLTLGHVISSLVDKKSSFVPYRSSVLTWLLKESLGGNSLTTMLATISPSSLCEDETLSTLRYACKAKQIVNKAQINENPQEKIIRELKLEVEKLKSLQSNYESMNPDECPKSNENHSNQMKELGKLQAELKETESRLAEAELSWQQKFSENKAAHLTSLAELEKLKEELESKMRIMTNSTKSIDLTPYKSNFLEELESVLDEDIDSHISDPFSIIKEWCRKHHMNYYLTSQNDLILTDYKNKKQTTVTIRDLDSLEQYKEVDDMMNNITWSVTLMSKQNMKKSINKSINALYRSLSNILLSDVDEDIDTLYETISKSVQKYETAIMDLIQKTQEKSQS